MNPSDPNRPFPRAFIDFNGLFLGSERTTATGETQLLDTQSLLRGTYDPRTNLTRDAQGLIVGHGNLLASLLSNR